MNSQAKTNENQEPMNIGPALKAMVLVLVAAPFLAYTFMSFCAQGPAKKGRAGRC